MDKERKKKKKSNKNKTMTNKKGLDVPLVKLKEQPTSLPANVEYNMPASI